MKLANSTVVLISAIALAATACGSDPMAPPKDGDIDAGFGDDGPLEPPDFGSPYIFPPQAYTGFDGTNTYRLALFSGLTNAVWSVEDPTMATVMSVTPPEELANYGESVVLLTTRKTGTTRVFATEGSERAEATVIISAYTPEQVTAGSGRYNQPTDAAGAKRTACSSCHARANGADHSPLILASFVDNDILGAITLGMYPEGYTLRGIDHTWNLTEAERSGIVAYLRQLPPRGF